MRLPHPVHAGVEDEKHRERDADYRQRIQALMHDHFIDYDLSEKRRGQGNELNRKGREQDVAPDVLMLEQLGDEPGKAEGFLPPGDGIRVGGRLGLLRKQYQLARITQVEILGA